MKGKEIRKVVVKEGGTLETRVYEVLKPNGGDWFRHGKKYNIEGLFSLIKNNNRIEYIFGRVVEEDLKRYEEIKKRKKELYFTREAMNDVKEKI